MPTTLPAPLDLGDLLEPFARRGIDLGLDRLAAALAEAGNPERRFPAVQVAGTNGKGSICTMVQAILRSAGVHSAAYRSPHLVSWCERIQIDDDWIRPELLRADLLRWQPIARRHRLTPFELLTAAAFDRFARERVAVAVLEVGLGGRLDATTVHPDRSVLGIAAIGLDHREHLGDTLAAIAREKAGAMPPGGVAFSAPQAEEVAEVLAAEARRRGCRLRWVPPLPEPAAGGPVLGLAGRWQRANAAVAVAIVDAMDLTVPERAVAAGLAAARWPGRLQRAEWQGRELLLDGAHNPPAAAALRQELDRLDGSAPAPRRWLLAIQRHKEAEAMLRQLLRPGDEAGILPLPGHACWSVTDLEQAGPWPAVRFTPVQEPRQGLDWLSASAALPVVAGSLYLLGQVLPLLERQAPAADG